MPFRSLRPGQAEWANPEHLELLRQGVAIWNASRAKEAPIDASSIWISAEGTWWT